MDDALVLQTKRYMLRKLINMGKIGGAHTALQNLERGMPLHLRSSRKGLKAIRQAVKELLNEGMLLAKPSTGETHVSINPRKVKEAEELLGI
ncbi:MAG: hypothetical protein V1676_06245 [Candidatus Diapherotrites archaeon]